MKNLESGQDKIQKICDSLRRETLEPAQSEAAKIIDEAKGRAAQIIKDAEDQAERIHAQARAEVEQERNVFMSSLSQASKQSVEALRQSIETKIFNQELASVIDAETSKPETVAKLISAIVKAVEDEGIDADLEAVVPKSVSAKDVSTLIGEKVFAKLKGDKITVGTFDGGAQLKLKGKNITIDISDETIKHFMMKYVREDFRKMIFAS
ncbi:MAG: V-type ATP synthase subunit E [Chlamydiota bacterium]|nr:V-type ATP synthase subunit E [Chlamydiota bacterium]